MFACFAFALSQTYDGNCLNDCIFCLCPHKRVVCSFYMLAYFCRHKRTLCSDQMFACFVVTKVWWVLFKRLDGLYLCRHKRTLFWLNGACFNLYFCRHKRIVCSVLSFFNALSLKFMLYMWNLCVVLSVDLLKNSSNVPFQNSLAIDKCHYENRQQHFCTSLGF